MAKRKTNEVFVAEAQVVHGYKYGYAATVYTDGNTRVAIHCPQHGFFTTNPYTHLKTKCGGCPQCKQEQLAERLARMTEDKNDVADTYYRW